ncbi:hypothetical protein KUTeg_019084 [Tegillarca granosa]|uniref:Glycosyltransferase family 92 protein n=1 Tax=Tegillarca granosa TaxID=220873 RepID=A0ABQ9EBH6_TEGGR|nr:hypothetical protein KUTeg_019084 [Tegillarca granosa]
MDMRFKVRKCFTWVLYSTLVYLLWAVWRNNSSEITYSNTKITTHRSINITTYRQTENATYRNTQDVMNLKTVTANYRQKITSVLKIKEITRNPTTKKCYEQISLKDSISLAQIDEEIWQPISANSKEIYVFSAFLMKSYVQIIAVKLTASVGSAHCRFWYFGGSEEIQYAPAKANNIPENKGRSETFVHEKDKNTGFIQRHDFISNLKRSLKNKIHVHSSNLSKTENPHSTGKSIRRNRNSTCVNVQAPGIIPEEKWQTVKQYTRILYVFSAFLVEKKVIIISARLTTAKLSVQCQLWFHDNDGKDLYVVPATYKMIQEGHGKKYTSAFYTCDLPKSANGYPYALSLVTEKCQKPENIVPVRHYTKETYEFTVCVTPFNFNYSRAYELVEMIELNRILGANHFVFYNYSINKNVERVLNYYKTKGIVEVLTWNLPMKVDTWPPRKEPVEIHYFAQLGALNDCLLRNFIRSKYLVYTDLDEFIIPRKGKSWREMLSNLPANQAAYTFRNVFFRKEWADTNLTFAGRDLAEKYKSVTLLKLKRESKILSKTQRAKYIINPKYIDTVGIHNIWRFKPGKSNHYVDPSIGLLNHYRSWEQPNDSVARMDDQQTLIYKDELLERLKDTWISILLIKVSLTLIFEIDVSSRLSEVRIENMQPFLKLSRVYTEIISCY